MSNNKQMHNRFDISVERDGKIIREVTAYNMVMDSCLIRTMRQQAEFTHILFGRGNGTIVPTRTSLFNRISAKTVGSPTRVYSKNVSSSKWSIVLSPEEFVGETITEVGLGNSTTTISTHALLKDAEGNPISITKTATDVVTISATVYAQTPANPLGLILLADKNTLASNILKDGSVGYSVSVGEHVYKRDLAGVNLSPTYNDVTKIATGTPGRIPVGSGNGRIRGMSLSDVGALSLSNIPGFTNQIITDVPIGVGDGIKTEFEIPTTWIKDETLTVKANAVAVSNFTTIKSSELSKVPYSKFPIPPSDVIAYNPKINFLCYRTSLPNSEMTIRFAEFTLDERFDTIVNPLPQTLVVTTSDQIYLTNNPTIFFRFKNSTQEMEEYLISGGTPVLQTSFSVGTGSKYVSPDGLLVVAESTRKVHRKVLGVWTDVLTLPATPYLPLVSDDGLLLTTFVGSYAAGYSVRIYDLRVQTPNLIFTGVSNGGYQSVELTMSSDGILIIETISNSMKIIKVNKTTYTVVASSFIATPSSESPSAVAISNNRFIQLGGVINNHKMGEFLIDPDYLGYSTVKAMETYNGSGPSRIGNIPASVYSTYWAILGVTALFFMEKSRTIVKFDAPPINGHSITASYTVNGFHKTDQFVLDISASIQFGEGVPV